MQEGLENEGREGGAGTCMVVMVHVHVHVHVRGFKQKCTMGVVVVVAVDFWR